jgi:hypothetical protein
LRRIFKMFSHPRLTLLVAFVSFLVGLIAVPISYFSFQTDNVELEAESQSSGSPPSEAVPTELKAAEDNCGPWTDAVVLKPIINRWLRNEEIKEVPYCSGTATEATAYNSSNVLPKLIDVNDDGIDELAVRYGCSPTGNCSMNIYQRVRRSYRLIFADRQAVSYFEKLSTNYGGFSDLQTRSHGSCCDGDQVHYRFNGKTYQPVSCAAYSYWDPTDVGEKIAKPAIKQRPCKEALDSQ